MNRMREPLFRASTKHANWDEKEEKMPWIRICPQPDLQQWQAGVYKVTCSLIFFSTLIFKIFDFLPQNFSPLPYSLNIIEQIILLPLTLFSTWYSSQKALKLPSPLHNLKFFPKRFNKLTPPPGVGNWELYTPLLTRLPYQHRDQGNNTWFTSVKDICHLMMLTNISELHIGNKLKL